jgi:ribosomal protein L35
MTSPSQTAANQANALHSTGPRTPEGKIKSSRNSLSHGLTSADPATIAQLATDNQREFATLAATLRAQLRPQGPAELELFAAYAWATFQAERARAFEAQAAAAFEAELLLDGPHTDKLLRRLDTLSKYRARHERSAAKAFRELGQLQADRLAANEVHALLQRCGINEPISPALPTARTLQKGRKPNPFSLAQDVMFGHAVKNENPPAANADGSGK